jgi:hypothetical protein
LKVIFLLTKIEYLLNKLALKLGIENIVSYRLGLGEINTLALPRPEFRPSFLLTSCCNKSCILFVRCQSMVVISFCSDNQSNLLLALALAACLFHVLSCLANHCISSGPQHPGLDQCILCYLYQQYLGCVKTIVEVLKRL